MSNIKVRAELLNKEGQSTEINTDGYKVYNNMKITRAEVMGMINMLVSSDDSVSSESNCLKYNFTNLPHNLHNILVYLTNSKNSEDDIIPLYPDTTQDTGFLGFANTDTGYSGSSTYRGTINLAESEFISPWNAKLVVDFPTHACNGQINTIHFGKKVYGTSNTTTQQSSHIRYHVIPANSNVANSGALGSKTLEFNDYLISFNHRHTNTNNTFPPGFSSISVLNKIKDYPVWQKIIFSKKIYDIIKIKDKLYAKLDNKIFGVPFDSLELYEIDVIKNDLNDYLEFNISETPSYPLSFLTEIMTETNKNYFFVDTLDLYDNKMAIITQPSGSNNGTADYYSSSFFITIIDTITNNLVGSAYNAVNMRLNMMFLTNKCYNPDDKSITFTIGRLCNSTNTGDYITIKNDGTITTINENRKYYVMKDDSSKWYNYAIANRGPDSSNNTYYYGYILTDKPFMSIELAQPLIKTDQENLKLTFNIQLELE